MFPAQMSNCEALHSEVLQAFVRHWNHLGVRHGPPKAQGGPSARKQRRKRVPACLAGAVRAQSFPHSHTLHDADFLCLSTASRHARNARHYLSSLPTRTSCIPGDASRHRRAAQSLTSHSALQLVTLARSGSEDFGGFGGTLWSRRAVNAAGSCVAVALLIR